MQRLLYMWGLILLASVAFAQVYGPLQTLPTQPPADTTPWVMRVGQPKANPTGHSSLTSETCDSNLLASQLDSLPAIDSACLVIDCVFKIEVLYLRYALSERVLRKIQPPAEEYGAEYREMPPPPVHIRQVVAANEVKPLNRRHHKGWLFTLLTFQFVLIVYLRVAFIRYAEEQYRSFFNLNISQQVFREQELSMPFPALLLTINGVLSYAVLLYLGATQFHLLGGLSNGSLYAVCLAIVLGIAGFKYLLMWFTSAIFPFKEEMNFYNFNFFLNIKIVGTLLLPLNFIIAYAPPQLTEAAIWTALGLLALAYLGLVVKGLAIAKNYLAFHKFHFIVYICSLEIAPVLIFIKLVMNAAQ